MNNKNTFRSDINALRALAIMLVLLFHFFPVLLPGGFLGVDVFFVISGYLMYLAIDGKLKKQQFSILEFYKKRFIRIIPAFAIMLSIIMVLAYFVLFTFQFNALVREALSGSLFFSNYYYFTLADYFDTGSYEKLFLHTWSLAVEFQFYLTFPLLLIACSFFDSPKTKSYILATVCFLSFVWSVYANFRNPSFAFYDVLSRYWEFLLGALVACGFISPKMITAKYFGICFLIIMLLLFFDSVIDLLGFYINIVVVLATVFFIASRNENSGIVKNKIIQYIGAYSYSIYLWHWPVVCFLVSFGYESFYFMVLGLVLSLVIGGFSFKYFEKSVSIGFIIITVVLLFSTTFVFLEDFRELVNGKSSEQNRFISRYHNMKIDEDGLFDKCNLLSESFDINQPDYTNCVPNSKNSVFIWGDSQAASLAPGIRSLMNPLGLSVSQVTTAGCGVLMSKIKSNDPRAKACNKSNQLAISQIALKKPQIIIISQRFGIRDDEYIKVAEYISQYTDHVFMIGPFPEWSPSLPLVMAKRHKISDTEISDRSFKEDLIILNSKLASGFESLSIDNISYIDVMSNLCKRKNGVQTTCKVRDSAREDLFFFDYGHLSETGSIYIANNILKPEFLSLQNTK